MNASGPHGEYERQRAYALNLSATGRHAQAIEVLSPLLHRFPDLESFTRIVLAQVHSQAGRQEEAVQQARLAVAAQPQDAKAHRALGRYLRVAGQLEEAEEHLRTSLQLSPQNAQAWVSLSLLLTDTGRREEAHQAGEQAATSEPGLSDAYLALGFSVLRTDPRLAEQYLREALRLDPEHDSALHLLALLHLSQFRARPGMRSVAQYAALAPQAPNARYLVDQILAKPVSAVHTGVLLAVFAGIMAVGFVADSGGPPVVAAIMILAVALLTALRFYLRASILHQTLPGPLWSRLHSLLRRRPPLAWQCVLLAGQWAWLLVGAGIVLYSGDLDPLSWGLLVGIGTCILTSILMFRAFRDTTKA